MNKKGKKEVIVYFELVVVVILVLFVLLVSMITASAENNKGTIEHCTAAGFPEEYCRNIL